MSKLPQEVSAFRSVMKAYEACRSNPLNTSGGYATLSNSVLSKCGKVHICPSDLVADVETAANHALGDSPNDRHVFKRVYLDKDEGFVAVFSRITGQEAFDAIIAEIESRVGVEFLDRRIAPLKRYREEVDTR